jgi:ElaB/YqjD/DUF883 family membrane-anchored ribosome-binding protein
MKHLINNFYWCHYNIIEKIAEVVHKESPKSDAKCEEVKEPIQSVVKTERVKAKKKMVKLIFLST